MIKLLSSVSAEKHFGTVISRNRNEYDSSRTTDVKNTLIPVKKYLRALGLSHENHKGNMYHDWKMDFLSYLILKHYSTKCSQIEIKIHRDKKCLVCIQLKNPVVIQRHFLKNRKEALSSLLRGNHWVLLRGTQVSSPCHQRGVSRWCWTYSQGKVLKLIKGFGLFCAYSKVTKKIAGWYDCSSLL